MKTDITITCALSDRPLDNAFGLQRRTIDCALRRVYRRLYAAARIPEARIETYLMVDFLV